MSNYHDMNLAAAASAATETPLLAHSSLNVDNSSTILLIHGAFTHHDDWDLVTPHLPQFHLLLPDLPGHGESRHISPFSTQDSARLLGQLVRSTAKEGKAHVIGHSLGAHVALALATSSPEVVNDMFISGVTFSLPSVLSNYLPRLMWLSQRLESRVPRPLVRWLMDGTDVRAVFPLPSMELCRQVAATISPLSSGSGKRDDVWPQCWRARTLIIAATKSGVVPSADTAEDARKLAEIGRREGGNAETVAYVHKGMRHPWNRQSPELFARTARVWFEDGKVGDGEGFTRV